VTPEIGSTGSALAALASLAVLLVVFASVGHTAAAQATPDPEGAAREEPGVANDPDPVDDAGPTPPVPQPPAPSVMLSGGAIASLPSAAEAWSTWRYGRDGANKRIDDSASHLRITGAGRTTDGLAIDFSLALAVADLHTGTYAEGPATEALASVWARRDRGATEPDVTWGLAWRGGREPRGAGLKLEVTSVVEVDHTSERRGGVTIDSTRSFVHGTMELSLPCLRSVAPVRTLCRTETLRGTF
jgi:hypothetical protein